MRKLKKKNVDMEAAEGNSEKEIKRPYNLLEKIIKEYPWPVKRDRRSEGDRKISADKTELSDQIAGDDQGDAVSTVTCPECGKIFVSLDEDGCVVEDFGRCDDTIGEGDEADISFNDDFDMLSKILDIYFSYIADDTYRYISHLTGVNLDQDEDWSYFLEELGITVTTNEWDDEEPGCSGYYSFLTVDRELQADLLDKLTVIKNRLLALEEADRAGLLEIQDDAEIIADLVDTYGANIPASDLLSLINHEPPPIGALTTTLLINWSRKQKELWSIHPSDGYGPRNDSIFLNWLAKGRQKEIMIFLKKNMKKDIETANIYTRLSELSSRYVNEKPPVVGGMYAGVARKIYNYNKELFSGFYVASSSQRRGKSKPDMAQEETGSRGEKSQVSDESDPEDRR